jgi:hypothetical protein
LESSTYYKRLLEVLQPFGIQNVYSRVPRSLGRKEHYIYIQLIGVDRDDNHSILHEQYFSRKENLTDAQMYDQLIQGFLNQASK